jgi:signal transduction histidine kinase
LTVIRGYLQSILRRSTNLNDYQQEALSTVSSEASRTVRLLQDLLELARADGGHLHIQLEPVLLNDLAVDVAAMAETVSDRQIIVKNRTIDVVAMADWARLKQVLVNLVDNAVKYSEPGQPVEICIEQIAKQAKIHVCDRGVGIPLQHQSRIFDRFYQVDESRDCTKEGAGLGLAIVKTLVEGMGGQIILRSKPGEGSEFTITLPIYDT